MGIRVVGIKEEARYGVAESAPDFHQEVSKAKAIKLHRKEGIK